MRRRIFSLIVIVAELCILYVMDLPRADETPSGEPVVAVVATVVDRAEGASRGFGPAPRALWRRGHQGLGRLPGFGGSL